jgi:threonine dehydrogenase-like Zn-dependent dehydrogenase
MAKTGRAVIYEGHREPPDVFRIVEYPVPEPRPGAVLLRITLANICGSDVHTYRGESRNRHVTEPRNPGHEGTGYVAALGEGVTTDSHGEALAVGDRVIFGHFYYCGRCRACLAGREWCCPTRRAHMNASSAGWPHFLGTFGDYHYLYPGHTLFKVPPGLADHVVSGINCALTQVHCGFDVAGLALGETVVIQGAGGLGIYAIAEARERGAARIIVVDGVQERLDLALGFGADDLVDMRELKTPAERIRRVKELTSGWGADLVLEVVGYPSVVEEGLQMVGSGGRYVEMGCRAPHLSYTAIPEQWATGNLTIFGSNNYGRRHLHGAIEFLSRTQSRYPYHKIVSHSFPLQQVNEAFAQQNTGRVTRASLVP